ncbi:CHASE3 domain-containing protein, partial [Microcoleus sp. K1-B1]|uniref:CHASE3 domain-containing protein n=1 Tax=Microcoleus sp. K1-B1 TaxID=2818782 RepID=UPI002FD5053C
MQALEKDLLDAETGQRGFIFTGKEEFLEPYKKGQLGFYTKVNETRKLIKDIPEQVKTLEKVENLGQQKLDELAETISLKRAGKEPELRALVLSGKGKILMDELRDKLAEMLNVEDNLLVQRTKIAKHSEQLATTVSIGGTVVAVVFGSFIVLFIFAKIIRPINEVANTIASSSTEIAATVEQQERTAAQQSSSVNQTTITMDELGAASQQSAQQAQAG